MKMIRQAEMLMMFVFLVLYVEVYCAGKRNITIGSTTYEVDRAQEKINAYSQCYVDIVVYNSTSFRFGLSNATVIVLAGRLLKGDPTLRFSEGRTDSSGHSCVPVACRDEAHIFVEKNSVRLSALNETAQRQNLPGLFYVALQSNNEIIHFQVNAWGTIQGRSGPVYSTKEKQKCQNATDKDFHFTFSYIAIPDLLMSTQAPPANPNNFRDPKSYNLWYYGLKSSIKYCFFKVKVKTTSHGAVIRAYSKLKDANGIVYGLFQTGPQYDANSIDTVSQAACVEYRCPAEDIFGIRPPMETYIQGTIKVPGHKNGCCVRNNNSSELFLVGPKNFSTNSALSSTKQYGPKFGIYMNSDKETARKQCFTGHDKLDAMNPNTGYAFEYDCLVNVDCNQVPTVIGK